MDELHARVRAFRSPPTEMNLAKQPDPELDDLDQAQRQGEANVVEMPHRQANEALALNPTEQSQVQRSTTRRHQGAAQRKPAASQKAFPFRQLRDGHQQPYIDELKRLEAQAERINQLLADRKRKQAHTEQSDGLTTGELPAPTERAVPKKKAPKGTRQPSKQASRSSQREVSPMPAHDDDTAALEAQAKRIKQLLHELETALADSDALPQSGSIEQPGDHQSTEDVAPIANPAPASPGAGVESFAANTYRYGADSLPFAAHQTQIMSGAIDQHAQQEATETAQALRYLASREPMDPTIAPPPYESRRPVGRSRDHQGTSTPSMRRYGLRLPQWLQMPQKFVDRVGDALLWIVLAAAMRVGAQLLLAQVPALTPILLVLMFTPAAVAVYLAMYVPRAGVISIYRLFLIMVGLLLGGRF